jgi:hypothetical protein
LIAASWALVEVFTGRSYWSVTEAVGMAFVPEAGGDVCWPRHPCPEAVVVEMRSAGAWTVAASADYVQEFGTVSGLVEGRYRITQTGEVTPDAPAAHVVEAVRALSLYQLIHSPARREFRQINAGDSSLTREALDGLFRASGAGILLAGEVRW